MGALKRRDERRVTGAGVALAAIGVLSCVLTVAASPFNGQPVSSAAHHQSSSNMPLNDWANKVQKSAKGLAEGPLKDASEKFKTKYGALARDSAAPIHSVSNDAATKRMAKDAANMLKAASSYQQDAKYSTYGAEQPFSAKGKSAQALAKSVAPRELNMQADYSGAAAVKSASSEMQKDMKRNNAKYQGDYAGYPGYYQSSSGKQYSPPAAMSMVAPNRNQMSAPGYKCVMEDWCNPCCPPPCPPCPPPPPPSVPCVTEIPLCIQYLINIFTIAIGIGILKWYCSAMSELDRQCGFDDRQGAGDDSLSRSLSTKKSSFSPPMATISAYYDPMTNQVVLPQEHHYQFTR